MSALLINAIRNGDSSRVSQLIKAGADPNYRLQAELDHGAFLDQVTPLMVAVAAPKSNAEIVKILLANGSEPFAVSAGEVSATWYASGGGTGYSLSKANLQTLEPDHPYLNWGGGDVERLAMLLDAGGDPNESASNGRSCVYEASSVGDPARLKLLIKRGAKVGPALPPTSIKDSISEAFDKNIPKAVREMMADSLHQLVPLFAASSEGNVECVKLIIEAGFPADFELNGDNAVTGVGNIEVLEYLWAQGVRPQTGRFGFDAIDDAIEADNLSVLRFLLRKVDRATVQEKLLTASGVRMNPRAVRLLLELGADANQPSKDYGSPLHYACWQGDGNNGRDTGEVEETIQLLIDAGADPNLLSRGIRPLHEAVFGDWGSPTSVRVLLSRGADINATNENGQTALIVAAQHGEVECLRLLLEAGANRTLKDNRGKIALDYASDHLKVWKKPFFKFLNRGIDKIFTSIGLNGDELSEKALTDAQLAVELLSS